MAYEETGLDRNKFEAIGGLEAMSQTVSAAKSSAIGALEGFVLGGAPGAVAGSLPGFVDAASIPYDYAIKEASTRNAVNRTVYDMIGNEAKRDLIMRARAQEINQTTVGELQSRNVVAPSVMFSPEINLGLYGYNKFGYYETCMHPDDMLEADRYFQRFGYSGLHKPLTAAVFNTRQYYNFVQAFGISIKTQGYGMRIRERAVAQLNSGVRVWHVLPDSSYYDLN